MYEKAETAVAAKEARAREQAAQKAKAAILKEANTLKNKGTCAKDPYYIRLSPCR